MNRFREERGSVSVEAAIVAPAFVFLLLLIVFAGRVSEVQTNVERAAADAARAASLRQNPSDAASDAHATAATNLAAGGFRCASIDVETDLGDFRPGGTVTVTVRCRASMRDVALLGVPGVRDFTAASVEVIDRYRGGGS